MGTTPRTADKTSRAKLDALICVDAQSRYSISLRVAANIIGFCEFPVGWSWSEYKPHQFERTHEYEKKARQVRLLGIEPDLTIQTRDGKAAENKAAAFRRRHVERYLQRLISREEIRLTLFDAHAQGHTASEEIRLHPGTQIYVETSSYGFPGCLWSGSLDAIDLTRIMGERRWHNERGKSHDWLVIERHVRSYVETLGLPKFDQAIFDHVLATLAKTTAIDSEPTTSTLRALIAELRIEYANL